MALPTAQGHGELPRGDAQWKQGPCQGRRAGHHQASVPPHTSAGMEAAKGLSASCHPRQDGGCPSIPLVTCGPQVLLSLHASQGQGRRNPVPHSRAAGGLCSWDQSPPFPLPLSQGQAEHKGCKQAAQDDMGTRDTMWGAGWPVALPRGAGEMGKAKAWGTKLSPAWQGNQGNNLAGTEAPQARCPVPLLSPWDGRWLVDKAIPQQLKVAGAVLVPSLAAGLRQDGA